MHSNVAELEVKALPVFLLDDEDDGDEKDSKAPQPLSSSALIKLAEGGEDLVEDLELSDDDWGSRTDTLELTWETFMLSTLLTIHTQNHNGPFAIFFAFEFCITWPVQYKHVHDVILLSIEIVKEKTELKNPDCFPWVFFLYLFLFYF